MIGKPVLCQIITGKDGTGQQSREMHTVNVTIDTDSVGKAKVRNTDSRAEKCTPSMSP